MNIYNKSDKEYLYLIMDLFLNGGIDEKTFCDEFYYSYDLEVDYSTLNDKESRLFFELSKVVSRFSEYPEDHKLDPKTFIKKDDLRKKILETRNALQNRN